MKLPIARVAGCDYYDGDLDGFVQDARGEWFAFGLLDWDCSITRVFGLARGDAEAIAKAAAAIAAVPRDWWPSEESLKLGEAGMVPEAREAKRLIDAAWPTAGEVFAVSGAGHIEETVVLHAPPPMLHARRLTEVVVPEFQDDFPGAEPVEPMTLIRWIEAGGDPIS